MNNDELQYYIYINVCLFSLCLLSYFLLLSFESGYANNDEIIRDANGENPLKYLIDENKDVKQYCPICFIQKSSFIKHCFICDKCVEGFEHHCFWLNKCIGKGNKIIYLIFIIIAFIYSLFSIFISVLCIFTDFNIIENSGIFFWISNDTDYTGFRVFASAFVFCYSTILSFPLLSLFLIKVFRDCGLFKKKSIEEQLLGNKNNIIDNERKSLYIEMNNQDQELLIEKGMEEKNNNEDNDGAYIRNTGFNINDDNEIRSSNLVNDDNDNDNNNNNNNENIENNNNNNENIENIENNNNNEILNENNENEKLNEE